MDEITVLFMAAGLSTRMGDAAHGTHKSMLYAGGKPLIHHVNESIAPLLRGHKVYRTYLVNHGMDELIDYTSRLHDNCTYIYVTDVDNQPASVVLAADSVRGSLLIWYADTVIWGDGYPGWEALSHANIAFTAYTPDVSRYCRVDIGDGLRIMGIKEKPIEGGHGRFVVGGYFIRDAASFMNHLRSMADEKHLANAVNEYIQKGNLFYSFPIHRYVCVDTMPDLEYAAELLGAKP